MMDLSSGLGQLIGSSLDQPPPGQSTPASGFDGQDDTHPECEPNSNESPPTGLYRPLSEAIIIDLDIDSDFDGDGCDRPSCRNQQSSPSGLTSDEDTNHATENLTSGMFVQLVRLPSY